MKLKNILSELKVVKSLNEIGEGVTPFPFQHVGSVNVGTWERIMSEYKSDGSSFNEEELPAIEYTFKSDKTTYKTKIYGQFSRHRFINFQGKRDPDPRKYNVVITVAFDDTSNPQLGEPGSEKITNYGEQFKVMSTVTKISIEVAKEIMEIDGVKLTAIHIGPKFESDEKGKPAAQTKRGRLYLEYIKKQSVNLPGTWTSVILDDRFVLYNQTSKNN